MRKKFLSQFGIFQLRPPKVKNLGRVRTPLINWFLFIKYLTDDYDFKAFMDVVFRNNMRLYGIFSNQ